MLLVFVGGLAGCNRDVRLADRESPHVEVRDVTHYGLTLDSDATPEQVAFVALRAIRDDVLAATPEARQAALHKQFDVAAANVIARRKRPDQDRDEWVYRVVYHWAPTVAHYVDTFPLEWSKAEERLVRRAPRLGKPAGADAEQIEVAMEVQPADGGPEAQVVLYVRLARDKDYWRVLHLGFDAKRTID